MSTRRTRKSPRLTTTAPTKKRVNRAMDAMEMDTGSNTKTTKTIHLFSNESFSLFYFFVVKCTDANAIGDQNRNIVLKTDTNSRDANGK